MKSQMWVATLVHGQVAQSSSLTRNVMRAAQGVCALVVVSFALVACKGGKLEVEQHPANNAPAENNQANNEAPNNQVEVNPEVAGVPTVYLRRLTQDEFDNTIDDLLGEDTRPASMRLPEDAVDPFDNNGEAMRPSQALIEALELVATDVADRAMADTARRDEIIGCTPSGPGDADCFRSFVQDFGKRAFRRPLTATEVDEFVALQDYALEADDFYFGAKLVIQAMLQMPDFFYHLQSGLEVEGRDGVYRLNGFEVASRLSYFLWGTMPDDELLAAAENGELKTSEQVRAQAERMLQDPRAHERMQRFHAMWLGYHRFSVNGTIGDAMLAETNALVDRVVFEGDRSYFELFTTNETYLNDELAGHYGLDAPGSENGTWVDVSASGRGGILSHATFLSVASKFGDTSPTQRGRLIRERIMCQKIQPPPADLNVDTDEPPSSDTSNCKTDRYNTILENPGCEACHSQMDPVGFGLENFDQSGQYRQTDVGEPDCAIDGEGELVGVGTFNGPRELGELLVESGALESCVVTQLWQFAIGGRQSQSDASTVQDLSQSFEESGYQFDELILDLVSHESFLYRVVPEEEPQ